MSSIDIYSILSSKPHNPHYLNRYYKYIQYCTLININISKEIYTENHHICPKSKQLFPEYKSFSLYNWNRVKLTGRQHLIAHLLLSKAYPWSNMIFGYNRMLTSSSIKDPSIKINSRSYEKLKKEISIKHSINHKMWHANNEHPKGMLGKKHSNSTKTTYFSNRFGENNPMFGKARPDLVMSNKDPILKAQRGKSISLRLLNDKLKRFNCNTIEELLLKINFELQNPNNYNKTGRSLNSPNFGYIAKNISANFKKCDGCALSRFYDTYKDSIISSSESSSTLI
jgi:hypothetical protein